MKHPEVDSFQPVYKSLCSQSTAYHFSCPTTREVPISKNAIISWNNILEFEMKGGDVMVLKFFVKTDKDGNEINSWYYETWKRVKMPPVYPKDLVR